MEKIVESAILFEGVVYTGLRHHNVIRKIIDKVDTKNSSAQVLEILK